MFHPSPAPFWRPLPASLIPLSMAGPLYLPSVPSASSSLISTGSASPLSPPRRWCHPPQRLLSWDNLPGFSRAARDFSRTGSAPMAQSRAAAELVPLQQQRWGGRGPGAGGPLHTARNKNRWQNHAEGEGRRWKNKREGFILQKKHRAAPKPV